MRWLSPDGQLWLAGQNNRNRRDAHNSQTARERVAVMSRGQFFGIAAGVIDRTLLLCHGHRKVIASM